MHEPLTPRASWVWACSGCAGLAYLCCPAALCMCRPISTIHDMAQYVPQELLPHLPSPTWAKLQVLITYLAWHF